MKLTLSCLHPALAFNPDVLIHFAREADRLGFEAISKFAAPNGE